MLRIPTRVAIAALGVVGVAAFAPATAAPNWGGVPGKDVVLFHPGQSSWEWVMTESDHSGAGKFRGGKNCGACHIGEEKTIGDLLVSGKKNEASPIAGKPGSMTTKVQFARDDENLYVRLEFAEGSQPNAKMDNAYATKVSMILDDGSVPEVPRAGCWAMCHEDNASMPSAGGASRTMYLGKTRAQMTRQGGGDALKAPGELAKLRAVEYWQANLNPGAPAVAKSGTVLDQRRETKPSVAAAEATFSGGKWSVTFSRKLNAGSVAIVPGKRYAVAFAIHAGHTDKRFHYVSFERSLVLDQGSADFVATKQ